MMTEVGAGHKNRLLVEVHDGIICLVCKIDDEVVVRAEMSSECALDVGRRLIEEGLKK